MNYRMKIERCLRRSGDWNRLSRRQTDVLIMIPVLLLSGCGSIRQNMSREMSGSSRQTDSVSLIVERQTKAIPVAASETKLTLSIDSLVALPHGAGYTARQGQASLTVNRAEDGMIEASANCDSLTLLVDELKMEVFHLNSEKSMFNETLKEEKTMEVNRLTSWQAFQIWTGRICLAALVLFTAFKLFKIVKS